MPVQNPLNSTQQAFIDLQDALKTSSTRLQLTIFRLPRRPQEVFVGRRLRRQKIVMLKTPGSRLEDMS